MTIELGLSIFGALVTCSSFFNAWVTNGVRMNIATLKLEQSEIRERDRNWLEDKFVMRSELDERFRALESRMGIKIF